jgi:DNA-directed RNA polymerase subunit RPC12/RpoP
MDGQSAEKSNCPTCGSRMILIRDVPRLGVLPPLHIYKCQECGVPLTETEEAKEQR